MSTNTTTRSTTRTKQTRTISPRALTQSEKDSSRRCVGVARTRSLKTVRPPSVELASARSEQESFFVGLTALAQMQLVTPQLEICAIITGADPSCVASCVNLESEVTCNALDNAGLSGPQKVVALIAGACGTDVIQGTPFFTSESRHSFYSARVWI